MHPRSLDSTAPCLLRIRPFWNESKHITLAIDDANRATVATIDEHECIVVDGCNTHRAVKLVKKLAPLRWWKRPVPIRLPPISCDTDRVRVGKPEVRASTEVFEVWARTQAAAC